MITKRLQDEHSWGQQQQRADGATFPDCWYEHLHAVAINNKAQHQNIHLIKSLSYDLSFVGLFLMICTK